MTSRLEYTLEYIKKQHLAEIKEVMGHRLEDDLSIQEVGAIEESLIESKVIAESCLSNCEECEMYMTHSCVRVLLHSNEGDVWCEGLYSSDGYSIDDGLEEKRNR